MLKRSNRLMLVLGVLLALVAFGGVLLFGAGSGNAQPAPPKTVSAVVASVDIPIGTALVGSLLGTIQLNVDDAIETYADPSLVVGQVVRHTVLKGQALKASDFATTNGSAALADISGSLKPGHVAIAVSVDGLNGVGGFVQQGDYVSVILAAKAPVVIDSSKLPGADTSGTKGSDTAPYLSVGDAANLMSVKVLVQNVQVLGRGAVGTPETASTSGSTSSGTDQVDPATGQAVPASSILILSVSPQQAEIIRFAQAASPDASLSLVLRAPGDVGAADVTTDGITLRKLVDKYGVLPPQTITVEYP